jgi:peptide/nickel transport system ATP-binding protein
MSASSVSQSENQIDNLLQVRDLKTYFTTERGKVHAVEGVDLDIARGKMVGLVGESGCGKSVTALSILKLLPIPPAEIVSGQVLFNGTDLLKLAPSEIRKIRGRGIGMIFQEPMTSLNPVFTIGNQITESILTHNPGMSKKESLAMAEHLLGEVGIPDPPQRLREYPHSLSGGMRQRAMIAMALSCDPELLIADEPTTALDVTIQAQILELLRDLRRERGMSILLITHDLGVVAEYADEVAVMYAGRIVERAGTEQLFARPYHHYTGGLIHSLPRIEDTERVRLATIPGRVPDLIEPIEGCAFAERCPAADDQCRRELPKLTEVAPSHVARCIHPL